MTSGFQGRGFQGRGRQALGRHGEAAVARWYEQRGFTVLARNWRCKVGEIDLVLRKGGTVVVCEVKTRSSDRFGSPFAAVTPSKQARLRRLAGCFMAETKTSGLVRIDVAGVTPEGIDVIEHAC